MRNLLVIALIYCSTAGHTQTERFVGKLNALELDGIPGKIYAGTYSVPEDRSTMVGRSIELNINVLPATEKAENDAVFVLKGPVTLSREIAFYANNLPELRKHRDIVLVDQRGSWGSGPLDMSLPRYANSIYTYQDDKTFSKKVGIGIREVAAKGDARFYTNAEVAADLESVRSWLGYESIDLWASGAGSVTARAYLYKYADHVRTLVMHSVQPIGHSRWTRTQRLARERLNEIFATCYEDSACHSTYPELSEHFGLLYDHLTRIVEYTDLELEDGSLTKIGIDQRVLMDILETHMRSATESSLIPWIIERAHYGDVQVLAQRADIDEREVPLGTYLCLACNEDPIHKNPRAITYDDGTPFDAFFFKKEVQICRAWPRSENDLGHLKPFKTNTPTLILSGSVDHTSPPAYGSEMLALFPNGRHLVLEGRSKNDVDAAMLELITEMIDEGTAKNLNTKALEKPLTVPFYVP